MGCNRYKAVQPATTPGAAAPRQVLWKPPLSNAFKINYDVAIFSNSNNSGIGVVIRNRKGLVIASLAQRLSQAYKAVEVEAMAAIRALEFAGEIGVDRIMVEGGSTIVTKALKTKHPGLASYGLLIEDARVLERNFSKLSYSHIKREGNKVRHCLARIAANFPNTIV